MKHISHYKERVLWATLIALFSISVLLLLTGIDSFTAMMSTAQIAKSCDKTIPSSVSCKGGLSGTCENTYSQQYVLNQQGDSMCCCLPVKIQQDSL